MELAPNPHSIIINRQFQPRAEADCKAATTVIKNTEKTEVHICYHPCW